MIRHIFKIIWTERKINGWILLELILVFCILWFCVDYMSSMSMQSAQPVNFDIEHTYHLQFRLKKNLGDADSTGNKNKALLQDLHTILTRIQKYPAVEETCISQYAIPHISSNAWNDYKVDTVFQESQQKWVTPGFFNVFRINMLKGNGFYGNSLDERNVIISGDRKDEFAQRPPEQVKTIIGNQGNDTISVIGIAARTKRIKYDDYNPVTYLLLRADSEQLLNGIISIRVKPEADHNFKKQFTKDMRSQLEIGRFYLASITSGIDTKNADQYCQQYEDRFKSIYSVTLFLLGNIFLGIIGTFWFRIQTRNSEIGLRIALGATKVGIIKMLLLETVLLIFMASVVSAFICINTGMTDLLQEMGVPIVWREPGAEKLTQHFINYGLTFVTLTVVAALAVWYPAERASRIFPAEALKSE